MTESISRVTPGSDTTQLRSLVVGYEPVVGCDNLRDRGADLKRPENTPGASAVDSLEQQHTFENQLGREVARSC